MSQSAANNLSKEKLQQLLAAVGATSQDDASQTTETSDFDWRQPRCFNLDQMAKLRCFADTIVEHCRGQFTGLYQDNCRVSLVSANQLFWQVPENAEEANAYYIPFETDTQKPLGILQVPAPSAVAWTGRVLGAAEQTETMNRKLSKLEASFLSDIATNLIGGFAAAYGKEMSLQGPISDDPATVDLIGSDALFEITFQVCQNDSEENPAKASFLIGCDKLQSIVGKEKATETLSEAQTANILLQHIHHMALPVSVKLGKVMIPFKDILNLAVNDVLVLDKNTTEPMDILIDNRTLFHGHPAQADGHHAVVIV